MKRHVVRVAGRKNVLSYRWAAVIGLLLLQVATGSALAQSPSLAINREGTLSGGNAAISGTAVCPTPPPGGFCYIGNLFVQVYQFVHGQVANYGQNSLPPGCNSTWAVTVLGQLAGFKQGQARVVAALYYACYDSSGSLVAEGNLQTAADVRLRRAR